MKSSRLLLVLVVVLLLGVVAQAQSGRRPTYRTPDSSTSSTTPSTTISNANGTCPQVLFPGEYGGLPARTTASNTSSTRSSSNPDAEEILKIDTTLVTIPVTVLDRSGKFIPYLTKCDFHLYEDNVMQEIADFSAVQTPFNVVLLLDTSNSTRFRIEEIHDAAIAFTQQLRSDDRVMVVSFDSDIKVHTDFTSDREVLRRAIRNTHNGGSTKLYDAVDQVLKQYLSRVQGRKAVVLFSDGVDTSSKRATDRSTIEDIEESDVLVYPIVYDTYEDMRSRMPGRNRIPDIWGDPRRNPFPRRRWPLTNWAMPPAPQIQIGRGQSAADYERAAEYMSDLATHSGGTLYRADSLLNVSTAFTRIAEELRHQYSLSYYPTNSNHDGTFRRVKVRVSQTGWVVKAKEGYRATGTSDAATQSNEPDDRPVLRRRNP